MSEHHVLVAAEPVGVVAACARSASLRFPRSRWRARRQCPHAHDRMHERLMDAYWAEACNIGDPDEPRALAAEVGLEGVDAALAGDAYDERIDSVTRRAVGVGATGVPAFVLDRRLLLLGAQPRGVFEQAFAQLSVET